MRFQPGDLVSTGYTVNRIVHGIVVLDGSRLRIQIEDGPRKGQTTYADAPPWELGSGPQRSVCRMCRRPFRHGDGEDSFFCASCNRDAMPAPYLPPAERTPARAEYETPTVGVHVAGKAILVDGEGQQRCRRCGAVLRRFPLDPAADFPGPAYGEGSLIERGRGWQAIVIRVGAEATCQPMAQQRTA